MSEELELAACPVCERFVPPGEFCGACGAHLPSGAEGAHRRHAFAANPGEHVVHLSVISTLFPHLPHRRSAPFRIALVAAVILLVGLGLLGLSGPAIAVAAAAVPLLYILYIYEVEVYGDEPGWVIGSTLVVGLVLGVPWAEVTGPLVTQFVVVNSAQGAAATSLLGAGVLVPLGAQVVMLIGPLLLYFARRHYDEAMDGFTFGVAAALGFTLATTVVNLLPTLQGGLFTESASIPATLNLVQRGLLVPLINASTTGLVAGALWLHRGEVRVHLVHRLFSSVAGTIAVAVVIQVALGLTSVLVTNSILVVAVYALAAALLLVWVRLAIHQMLLAEAVEHDAIGPLNPCTNCHRVVPRMGFCPHCGIATRSTPKGGQGKDLRSVRSVT